MNITPIIQHAIKYKISRFVISGGEPFLQHREGGDLFKALRMLNSKETIRIITNGIFLQDILDELKLLSCQVSISLSYHYHMKNKKSDYCKELIESFFTLERMGIKTNLNVLINKDYRQQILEDLILFKRQGINHFFIFAEYSRDPLKVISDKEWTLLYTYFKRRFTDSTIIYDYQKAKEGHCGSMHDRVIIRADGSIIPCMDQYNYIIGNIYYNSIVDIFHRAIEYEKVRPSCSLYNRYQNMVIRTSNSSYVDRWI